MSSRAEANGSFQTSTLSQPAGGLVKDVNGGWCMTVQGRGKGTLMASITIPGNAGLKEVLQLNSDITKRLTVCVAYAATPNTTTQTDTTDPNHTIVYRQCTAAEFATVTGADASASGQIYEASVGGTLATQNALDAVAASSIDSSGMTSSFTAIKADVPYIQGEVTTLVSGRGHLSVSLDGQ